MKNLKIVLKKKYFHDSFENSFEKFLNNDNYYIFFQAKELLMSVRGHSNHVIFNTL